MWPERPESAARTTASEAETAGGAPGQESTEQGSDESYGYPEGDFLQLDASTSREGDEFILYLEGDLDAQRFPFRLQILVGARYEVKDVDATAEEVEPTLVWLAYPYLRELIASITGRSPAPSYFLPTLSLLPHPSVLSKEADEAP